MPGASETYHEPVAELTPATRDLHRAITSLREELEAVDWYHQRAEAASDPALRAILVHNRDEEIEHATMLLEWLRRNDATFDRTAATYLFTAGPITSIENGGEGGKGGKDGRGASGSSLGIGSLKPEEVL